MMHVIRIHVETVQRAPGTIITREATIVYVQEDTRAKTATIMLVREFQQVHFYIKVLIEW